jgi:protein subunit release factor A
MLTPEDIRIDTFRGSPARLDTHHTCVRVTHLPTGTVVTVKEYRTLFENRKEALRQLEEQLMKMDTPA